MKKCSKCNIEKSIEDFGLSKKNKDGRLYWCKACMKVYDQQRWKTPERKAAKLHEARAQYERNRKYIWDYLSKNPCITCDESDPVVLEFDHRDGTTKKSEVSSLVSWGSSLKILNEEIAKCDVLCANCHRRKTAIQLGWKNYSS